MMPAALREGAHREVERAGVEIAQHGFGTVGAHRQPDARRVGMDRGEQLRRDRDLEAGRDADREGATGPRCVEHRRGQHGVLKLRQDISDGLRQRERTRRRQHFPA